MNEPSNKRGNQTQVVSLGLRIFHNLSFLCEAKLYQLCPSPLANEVAIIGRSNAGKSSLINQIAGQKRLARVSATPGRTQSLVFFGWQQRAQTLADLPGYGFAKTSKTMQKQWQVLIEDYLLQRPNLRALVLVMDCRRSFQEQERMLVRLAQSRGLALCIALNKSDKLKAGRLAEHKRRTLNAVEAFSTAMFAPICITTSAVSGAGCEPLVAWLVEQLALDTPSPDTAIASKPNH